MLRPRSAMTLAPLTVVLTLLSLACSSSLFPPTPIPAATTPIAVVPSPTATPGGATDEPGDEPVEPEPLQVPSVSLQPTALEGWASSLIVSGTPNATKSGVIQDDGQVYVSWAITNAGPDSANKPFSIDLLLDGVPVERWASKGLFVDETQSVRDWTDLPVRLRLTVGEHSLTLVVDSTGYVQARDADSNTVSVSFDWPQIDHDPSVLTVAPDRLPNLSAYTPPDWESPINLEGLPTREEALFNPRDPRIQIAYKNSGLSSIGRFFLVYVYLDGVLVTKFSQLGLIAEEAVVTPPWRELLDIVHIPIGFHSLSFLLDPTDLIDEADENDNFVSLRFFWGEAASTAELPSLLVSDGRPNLVNYVPTGWSGSLIVTSYPGRTGSLGPVYIDGTAFASWAIQNDSTAALEFPFTVDLLLGDSVIKTWERPSITAGTIDIVLDDPIPGAPQSGVFEMSLLAHMENAEGEPTGTVLLARRAVGWREGNTPVSETDQLEPEGLKRRLAFLETLRSSKSRPSDSDQQRVGLLNLVDAVYQTLYQRPLRDEPLAIHILTNAEFERWVDAECRDVAPTLDPSVQDLYLARCETTKEFIGYHTSWRGAFRIVVKGERPPMQVLSTIAHELGHFRQSLTNPTLDNQADLNVLTLREAQAYAHQVLFFRTLESLTGLDLLLYPQLTGYETFIEMQVDALRRNSETSEHARGQLVLWLALLADPNLRKERTILLNNLSMPAATAEEVFTYLVAFSPDEARLYVRVLLRSISAQVGAIESLALARLVPGLPYWNEGSPDLREIGLLMP